MKKVNIFNEFFVDDTLQLNWEYIDAIPEFQQLKNCQQPAKWHQEGSAYEHTKHCVEEVYKNELFARYSFEFKRVAVMSVLFHDIGKIATTEFFKGDWHSYNHEIIGEKIARRILWDYTEYRELVCKMVRWHMERCGMIRCKNIYEKCVKIALEMNDPIWCTDLLYIVMKSDICGSTPQDMTTREVDLNIISTMRTIMANFDRMDSETQGKIKNNLMRGKNPWENPTLPKVMLYIGLPGAGKDTLIEKTKGDDDVVVCRDDIRAELGFCKPGEKVVLSNFEEKQVSDVFNERILKAAENGKNIIINNINLKRKYRDGYKQLLSKYKYEWVYCYVEAPTLADNISRRDGQIAPEIFKDMIEKFDWPSISEYDLITVEKQ